MFRASNQQQYALLLDNTGTKFQLTLGAVILNLKSVGSELPHYAEIS